MEKMKKTLETVTERIRWAGNIYGPKWREEVSVLEPCKEALETVLSNEERYREHTDDVPPSRIPVLVQFSTDPDAMLQTGIGWYVADDGWYIFGGGLATFTVHKWRYFPEWAKEEPENETD